MIGGSGSLGAGGSYAATISNSGAFVYNSTTNQTLSGIISGTGSLTESGNGMLTLTASNTYIGATTIGGGTLTIGGGGCLGTGGVYAATISNSAAFVYAERREPDPQRNYQRSGHLDADGQPCADPHGQQYLHRPL